MNGITAVSCGRFCFWRRQSGFFVCVWTWFAPDSHERRVWSLARTSLKVKDQGHQEQQRHFSAISAACVRFMFGKISLASSLSCVLFVYLCRAHVYSCMFIGHHRQKGLFPLVSRWHSALDIILHCLRSSLVYVTTQGLTFYFKTSFTVYFYFSPGRCAKYCDERVYMSVCLSVRSHISKATCPDFTKFFVHVVCGHGSALLWRQCNTLCTSGFADGKGSANRA